MSDQPSLETLLNLRTRTDSPVPVGWISVSIVSYAVWALIAWVFATLGGNAQSQPTLLLSFLATDGFLTSPALAYLAYMLINRRNTHLEREEALLGKAVDLARSRTRQDDLKTLLPLSSAEHNLAQLSQGSGERSAILWGLLTIVPFVGWLALIYVLTFLSRDMKKHELREELVVEDLDRAFLAGGDEGIPTRERRSHYSTPVGYCVLSLSFLAIIVWELFRALSLSSAGLALSPGLDLPILGVGIVGLGIVMNLWTYRAMTDPSTHFQYHQRLEAAILKTLSTVGVPSG